MGEKAERDHEPARQPRNQFRLEGEYWTIVYDGDVYRLKDTAGLRSIAYLLRHPGQPVSAADLVAVYKPAAGGPSTLSTDDLEICRVKVTRAIKAALGRIGVCSAPLIAHLAATIKTGSQCSYTPDPRLPVEWEF